MVSLVGILSGCAVSGNISTRDKEMLMRQVTTRPYVVGLEGLGAGGFAKELTEWVCRDLGYCGFTTAGNPFAHLDLIREAKKNGQKVYVIGHSLGGGEALKLARLCEGEGINIEGVYILETPWREEVPGNILEFGHLLGTKPYIFKGPETRRSDLKNLRTNLLIKVIEGAGHFDLPMKSKDYIEQEILNGSTLNYNDEARQIFREACRQGKGKNSSEIFQDWKRGVWGRRHLPGDYCSRAKKDSQRVCSLNSRGYSRTA